MIIIDIHQRIISEIDVFKQKVIDNLAFFILLIKYCMIFITAQGH